MERIAVYTINPISCYRALVDKIKVGDCVTLGQTTQKWLSLGFKIELIQEAK